MCSCCVLGTLSDVLVFEDELRVVHDCDKVNIP